MSAARLSTESLALRIGSRTLCQNLSLQILPGECWGILGQNGAGKTTLLHTLAGIRRASAGDIRLDGTAITDLPRRRVAQRLGLMPQDNPDPFPATVLDTALIGRHPHLSRWQWESQQDRELALATLQQLGLDKFQHRQINTLSGGERRRLALATLLVQAAPLMLLDEPTNHLDLRHQQQVLELLKEKARQQHSVVMVLHDINQVSRFCDHVLLMFDDGETRHGNTQEILTSESLSLLYGTPIVEAQVAQMRWFMAR